MKKEIIIRTTILLIVLVGSFHAFSQTHFVSNLSEFNTAVSQAQPGDEIVLANGVWQNVELEFTANGAEGDSITLTAETPGEVVLTGTSKLEIAGDYLIVKDLDFNGGSSTGSAIISFRRNSSNLANHSRVTNCRIINYNPSSDATEYKWVSLYGEHNRVDHCHFEGKNNEGALLVVWLSGDPNYHRIDHNYFANIPELGRNGGETIRIGTSANSMTESRTVVEYNLFESCDGEIEIISNKSGFNIYRYNTFRDNEGTLTLRHGNDCEVYGNFFFGQNKRSGGVRIIGERHKVFNNYFEGLNGDGFRAALCMTNGVPNSPLNRYFQVKNAEVVHNTFVACKEPISIGEGKSDELNLAPVDCIIANNVVDQTTGSKAVTYTDEPENFTYSDNYVNGTAGITDAGIINQDPLLVHEEGIWKLSQSSPVIDNGTLTFDYVINDLDGQARDSNPDIGSDEFSSLAIVHAPLTTDDVGYSWEEEEEEVTTPVIAGMDDREVKVFMTKNSFEVFGVSAHSFPLRVVFYNLDGQVVDEKIQKDSIPINDFTGKILIVQLMDRDGQQMMKRKVIVQKN